MAQTCNLCSAPLVDPDTGIPDAVVLPCGDSFHYPCIEDEYLNYPLPSSSSGPSSSSSSSSSAAAPPSANSQQNHFPCPTCSALHNPLLATLTNEGGTQHSYNLGTHLAEEAFYDARPDLKRQRAWMSFCASGDLDAMMGILEDDDEEEDAEEEEERGKQAGGDGDWKAGLLNAMDPETGGSALHVAAGNQRWEVVKWLLINGADVDRVDNAGRSVLDVVRAVAGDGGVAEVLQVVENR